MENIEESFIEVPRKPADSSIPPIHVMPIIATKSKLNQKETMKKLIESEGNLIKDKIGRAHV